MIDAEKATPNMPPVTRMVDLLGVSRSATTPGWPAKPTLPVASLARRRHAARTCW